MPVELTLLNAMAGADLAAAMDQHVRWGLRLLDLKDGLFGKAVGDLTEDDARRVQSLAAERGLSVYCFSTGLLHANLEHGEAHFRRQLDEVLPRVLAAARVLQPRVIRLLSMSTQRRATVADAIDYVRSEHRWALDVYRDAIDRIRGAGFTPMIENEVGGSIFSTPGEIVDFFGALDRDVRLIWDISNLWQMGTPPSLAVYEQLRPLIGGVHLKGARAGDHGELAWATALEDSSWPVRQIVGQVIADGVTPVLVLNPPHGRRIEGYDYTDLAGRDVRYVQTLIRDIEGGRP